GLALIKDMDDPPSPLSRTGEQQLGLFIALEGGVWASRTPPALGGQARRSLLLTTTDQQHPYPLQTRHEDRLGRRRVIAFLVMGEALGEAAPDRTEPLELL